MKNIKHNNIMAWSDKRENEMEIVCRGCSMQGRERIWESFVSSISGTLNRSINNSYLTFEEEPSNRYDPNAIKVVCRGEIFGAVGYVGREYTSVVKEILLNSEAYRIDMADEGEVGQKEIRLVVSWTGYDMKSAKVGEK